MNNIEPWCISRQLWWGHQIPAWYGPDKKIFVAYNEDEAHKLSLKHYKKKVDFIGKSILLEQKEKKPKKNLIILTLKNSKPGFPLLLHDEPIYANGKIIGRTTSGNYSFNYKKNMAFGYITPTVDLKKSKIEIEVEKNKYEAVIENKPLHDPENKILKS